MSNRDDPPVWRPPVKTKPRPVQAPITVLEPVVPGGVISVSRAAALAGRSASTVKNWCDRDGIGVRVGGKWSVSAIALFMRATGNEKALLAYIGGDRSSELVVRFLVPAALGVLTTGNDTPMSPEPPKPTAQISTDS